MHFSTVYSSFKSSLRWNALLFIIYKTLFIIVSLFLFKSLSINDFSIWANLNSIMFLLLLLLDLGFRKSIPRYCFEFEKIGKLRTFTTSIFCVHAIILIVAIPCFFLLCRTFFSLLGLLCLPLLVYICGGIFFVEGINSTIKLFYHAYFLNKNYTLIQTAFLLIEWTINFSLILFLNINSSILVLLFGSKLIIGLFNAILSIFILNRHYPKNKHVLMNRLLTKVRAKEFVAHSFMMWFGNITKSLTERNFLVPFITYFISPATGNLFKIANDWAMLIYRPIIRTIGSSDTVLLSHAQDSQNRMAVIIRAQNKLLKTIFYICLPFCCIIPIATIFISPEAIFIFSVITLGCIFETILSPYERILEVKRRYRYLFASYFPYLTMLGGIGYYLCASGNLLFAFIAIHLSRLSGSLLMVYFSKRTDSSSIKIHPASLLKKKRSSPKDKIYHDKRNNNQLTL